MIGANVKRDDEPSWVWRQHKPVDLIGPDAVRSGTNTQPVVRSPAGGFIWRER